MRITEITGGLVPTEKVAFTPAHREALENVLAEQELSANIEISILESGAVLIEDEVSANIYTQNYKFVESIARIVADPIVAELNLFGGFSVETTSSIGDPKSHIITVEDNVVRFHRTQDDPGTIVELTVASDPERIKASRQS